MEQRSTPEIEDLMGGGKAADRARLRDASLGGGWVIRSPKGHLFSRNADSLCVYQSPDAARQDIAEYGTFDHKVERAVILLDEVGTHEESGDVFVRRNAADHHVVRLTEKRMTLNEAKCFATGIAFGNDSLEVYWRCGVADPLVQVTQIKPLLETVPS